MGKAKRHPGVGWQPMARAVRVPPTPEQVEKIIEMDAQELLDQWDDEEMWKNNRYTVSATRREDGSVAYLSIRRNDRRAIRDWRDFQRIKTEIAGADVEAVELFPAEGRLMDTANQYWLWCFPPGTRLPFGFDIDRTVSGADHGVPGAVQRELPEDWQ